MNRDLAIGSIVVPVSGSGVVGRDVLTFDEVACTGLPKVCVIDMDSSTHRAFDVGIGVGQSSRTVEGARPRVDLAARSEHFASVVKLRAIGIGAPDTQCLCSRDWATSQATGVSRSHKEPVLDPTLSDLVQ